VSIDYEANVKAFFQRTRSAKVFFKNNILFRTKKSVENLENMVIGLEKGGRGATAPLPRLDVIRGKFENIRENLKKKIYF